MSTLTDISMTQCAACGKGGDSLKKCNACKLVKYCSVDCQRAHRPRHKKECKKRAAELHDEALFKQPPRRDECPICMLELPIETDMWSYKPCCGKRLCSGCAVASVKQKENEVGKNATLAALSCPFCREPTTCTVKEEMQKIEGRMELNDPNAFVMMGCFYEHEDMGFRDRRKAVELWQKASDLGSIEAHYFLGNVHLEVDEKKARHHLEIAAMMGQVIARHDLGAMDFRKGNVLRAMKHFMISASAGDSDSLGYVQLGYRDGIVAKDDFEKTLRAHKESQDELNSEWRDEARVALAMGRHRRKLGKL